MAHDIEHPGVDPVIPLRKLAGVAGCSIDTLKRRGRDGSLRIIRISPRLLGVRASEWQRYLAACEDRR
jgi:hypothetical protein